MTTSTLASLMAADFYVTLNPDEFGEWLSYRSAAGQPRRVAGRVTHVQDITEVSSLEFEEEIISVEVGADEDHQYGGVAQPVFNSVDAKQSDSIVRENDTDGTPYAFIGRGRALTDGNGRVYGWRLEFRRPKVLTFGKR